MKKMIGAIMLMATVAPTLSACGKAQANQQTLVTHNCGVSWELISPGSTLPAMVGYCSYKVTIPNYPMPGQTRFRTSFANRVLATVDIAYEYEIIDGKTFISEARYLGRSNSEGDDKANAATAYETAENVVIDKRLRDLVSEMLIKQDIVEFNQGEFEDELLEEINKRLASKGTRLNFISFVPTPEEQTRLAIDMATAMKVYESKGLLDVGKAVAAARAGATKIEVRVEGPKGSEQVDE